MTFNKQDILDAFKRRVATRYYDGNRKISDEDMKFILELGRLSPARLAPSLGVSWSCKTRRCVKPSSRSAGAWLTSSTIAAI